MAAAVLLSAIEALCSLGLTCSALRMALLCSEASRLPTCGGSHRACTAHQPLGSTASQASQALPAACCTAAGGRPAPPHSSLHSSFAYAVGNQVLPHMYMTGLW